MLSGGQLLSVFTMLCILNCSKKWSGNFTSTFLFLFIEMYILQYLESLIIALRYRYLNRSVYNVCVSACTAYVSLSHCVSHSSWRLLSCSILTRSHLLRVIVKNGALWTRLFLCLLTNLVYHFTHLKFITNVLTVLLLNFRPLWICHANY